MNTTVLDLQGLFQACQASLATVVRQAIEDSLVMMAAQAKRVHQVSKVCLACRGFRARLVVLGDQVRNESVAF